MTRVDKPPQQRLATPELYDFTYEDDSLSGNTYTTFWRMNVPSDKTLIIWGWGVAPPNGDVYVAVDDAATTTVLEKTNQSWERPDNGVVALEGGTEYFIKVWNQSSYSKTTSAWAQLELRDNA